MDDDGTPYDGWGFPSARVLSGPSVWAGKGRGGCLDKATTLLGLCVDGVTMPRIAKVTAVVCVVYLLLLLRSVVLQMGQMAWGLSDWASVAGLLYTTWSQWGIHTFYDGPGDNSMDMGSKVVSTLSDNNGWHKTLAKWLLTLRQYYLLAPAGLVASSLAIMRRAG